MFVLTEVALQTGHGQEWLRPTFEIADFASLENKQNKSRSKQNHTNKTKNKLQTTQFSIIFVYIHLSHYICLYTSKL